MNHIVMYSGGVASWAAADRVIAEHGTANTVLLFADTRMEDEDLYRFLDESAGALGASLVKIADGRTPWEVFFKERYIGNTRVDPCSKILKRQKCRTWLEQNYSPDTTTVYLGLDWTEEHRLTRAAKYWEPWTVAAPLLDRPLLMKDDMIAAAKRAGIAPPRLYAMGFPHNNCGGFCVKAGIAHFLHLLSVMPERYAYHEEQEQKLRGHLQKDISILRSRRGGEVRPLTLKELRENSCEYQRGDDWGGCGCFGDDTVAPLFQ